MTSKRDLCELQAIGRGGVHAEDDEQREERDRHHDDAREREEHVGERRAPNEVRLERDALQPVVHRLHEERPRQQSREQEHRVVLERDVEHAAEHERVEHEQQQRRDDGPDDAEHRALRTQPELPLDEDDEQLPARDELAAGRASLDTSAAAGGLHPPRRLVHAALGRGCRVLFAEWRVEVPLRSRSPDRPGTRATPRSRSRTRVAAGTHERHVVRDEHHRGTRGPQRLDPFDALTLERAVADGEHLVDEEHIRLRCARSTRSRGAAPCPPSTPRAASRASPRRGR